jgi:hypothetical protein
MPNRLCCFALCLAGLPAFAQWIDTPTQGIPRKNGKPDLTAPAPKLADGRTDFSGLWARDSIQNVPPLDPNRYFVEDLTFRMPKGAAIPMLPAAQEVFRQRLANDAADRPSGMCLPHGVPSAMGHGGPFKIIHSADETVILFEEFNQYRHIFTDGRGHPKSLNPTWYGYSIGKWDGNSFLVDTKGFNDRAWLDDIGHPQSEGLHTIERFRRPDFGHLEVDVTIEDPLYYSAPFTATFLLRLAADTDQIEDVCENERDAYHIGTK